MAKEVNLSELLKNAVHKKASDVHLGEGLIPMLRIDTKLVPYGSGALDRADVVRLLLQYLPEDRFRVFEKEKELDFSFGIEGLGRFRANLFFKKSEIGCAIRILPFRPMTFDEIGFPKAVAEGLVSKPSGLILVTGATGSGKSTTLAAMIDCINQNETCHIVTVEDPMEFIYQNKKSIVSQREVGSDTGSFSHALKYVLRQDPDVILIGEMRDLETIESALTAAETGHLVFATLHTPDTVQSINRIIDVFPSHQQPQVRVQFSFVLQAVISQQLLPRIGGGLALASEILLMTPAIRNLIRESKAHQIYSSIQMGQKEGMRTLNMSLAELVKLNQISKEDAYDRSLDVQELERLIHSR
jgi:twitching motility protein PilT